MLTIELDRALELLAEPKAGRRGARSKSKEPLRSLGAHPADEEPINIYDGPYGPYIKHGKTNVSVPEDQAVESITLEAALELLGTKESTSKSGRKSTKAASGTKKATKSTAAKSETTTSKTKTRKTTTKKSGTSSSKKKTSTLES